MRKWVVHLAVRMVKLERDPKSGSWASRKVIPADVRAAYGQANEVKRWPAALTPTEAKFEQRAWLDEVEAKIERLRKMAVAAPVRLSRREIAMYAGQWYRQQTDAFSENPGDPEGWEATMDVLVPDEAHALPPTRSTKAPGCARRSLWRASSRAGSPSRTSLVPSCRTPRWQGG